MGEHFRGNKMGKKCFFVMLFSMVLATFVFADYEYYYSISTGRFTSDDGWSVSCHSGADGYVDMPSAINLPFKGPIPVGDYYMIGVNQTINGKASPNTIVLEPFSGNMYNRDNFRIHGGTNSAGCILMNSPANREKIATAVAKYKSLGYYPILHVSQ
jgi:hypothetical protein